MLRILRIIIIAKEMDRRKGSVGAKVEKNTVTATIASTSEAFPV